MMTSRFFTPPPQGIVHIIGPEQGFTLPGSVCVCGDSHTSTHGAFGALAFGIGTSEVEHVLATQTLLQKRAKNMRMEVRTATQTPVWLPFTVAVFPPRLELSGRARLTVWPVAGTRCAASLGRA